MRTPIIAAWLIALSTLMKPVPSAAVPLSPHIGLEHHSGVAQLAGYRTPARHRHHRGCKHRHLRDPHRHLRGHWDHDHCGDWHRCHYYFYGYKQWLRWNPGKSRAYFIRHYHHR
jgi:hypothetical protein